MPRASRRPPIAGLLLALALTAALPGCPDGGGGRRAPTVSTFVHDDRNEPVPSAPGTVVGRPGTSRATETGRLRVRKAPSSGVIALGDSVATPTFLFPVSRSGRRSDLGRGVFLPDLGPAESFVLSTNPPTDLVFAPGSLPGLEMRVDAGTIVQFPPGLAGLVSVLPIPTDRLPEPLPPGRSTRAAYAIEPLGAAFDPAPGLDLPNVDGLPPGTTAELWRVHPMDGLWEPAGTLIVDATGRSLQGGSLPVATIVAALPTGPLPTTTVTGRLTVGGGFGVADYPLLLPGSTGDTSRADGGFAIGGVPLGRGSVRLHVQSHPGVRGEVVQLDPLAPSGDVTDAGDIVVGANAPDIVKPSYTSNPADGDDDVSEHATITLTFDEPMDRRRLRLEVVSTQGDVSGTTLVPVDGRSMTFVPDAPLTNAARHTVILDDAVADPSGNRVPENDRTFAFITRDTPGSPPSAVALFGVVPAEATEGDVVTLVGRNFPGGSNVTVGGVATQVLLELGSRIDLRIPAGLLAGSRTIAVNGQSGPAVRVLPRIDAVDPAVGDPGGGYPVVITGTSLGDAPAITFHGDEALLATTRAGLDVAFHPATPATVLLATTGGVFRSVDGGATWAPPSPATAGKIVHAVAFDQSDPARAYAALHGGDVAASPDSGLNWTTTAVAPPGTPVLDVIAVPGPTVSDVLAATTDGVYRSGDSGTSWVPSPSPGERTILDLSDSPPGSGVLLAGTTGGAYLSAWLRTASAIGHATVLSMAAAGTPQIYLSTPEGVVHASDDGGLAWREASSGLPGDPVACLAVDPTATATVYAGTLGAGVWKSTDGGTTWAASNGGMSGADVLALAIDPADPQHLLAATEGAIAHTSINGGASWSISATGIALSGQRVLAIPPRGVGTGAVVAEVGGMKSRSRPFLARRWPDDQGPAVVAVDPADGATGVPTATGVTITLDEPVLSDSTFVVSDGGPAVPGSFTVRIVGDTSVIEFLPDAPLAPATTYTVTVTSGVRDVSGNEADADWSGAGIQIFGSTFATP